MTNELLAKIVLMVVIPFVFVALIIPFIKKSVMNVSISFIHIGDEIFYIFPFFERNRTEVSL